MATDAIGMGLNMDVDHVAFAGLRKFDGKRTRCLYPQEIGQIAGRAGRFRGRDLRRHRRAPTTWTRTWSRRSRTTASSR